MDIWCHESNLPEEDITGLDLQAQQHIIFLYNIVDNMFSCENGLDTAFVPITVEDVTLPRIAWCGYHAGVILHGSIAYSDREKNRSTNNKRIGPYIKVLIVEDWDAFKNWSEGKFKYGIESENVIQWNAKDLNNYIQFIEKADFPECHKKIQCFRFDPWGDDTQFGGKLFTKGKDKFKKHIHRVFGYDKRIDEIFEYFFELGLNLVPANCIYRFSYDELASCSSISKTREALKKIGIEISVKTAKHLQTFLSGAAKDLKYTNMGAVDFREVVVDNWVIPELGNASISVSLCPHREKKRTISPATKREVLTRWNYQVFNSDCNCLTGTFYENVAHYLAFRTCQSVFRKKETEWLRGRDKKYYIEMKESIHWDPVYEKWGMNYNSGIVMHHPFGWDILFKFSSPGFDCNHPKLLIPILSYDHNLLHSVCGQEGGVEQIDLIVKEGWLSRTEIVNWWAEAVIHIIKEEQKLSGKKTTLIKYLIDNGYIPNYIVNRICEKGEEYGKILSDCGISQEDHIHKKVSGEGLRRSSVSRTHRGPTRKIS